jgi:rubrerythrin
MGRLALLNAAEIRCDELMNSADVGSPRNTYGWTAAETDLFAHLSGHAAREGAILDEYAQAAEATKSKALAYLIEILMEDERRHHRWFAELAASLEVDASFSGTEPVVPRMDFRRADRVAVRDVTARLLEHEKADEKELNRLQQELAGVSGTWMWGLLVELMQRDTDKHIAVLTFVKKHLTALD